MCTVLLPPGVNPIAVNKYINIYTYTSKLKAKLPQYFFQRCPKTAPMRRSMKWITTKKPKFRHRKTCPEIFLYRIYRLHYVAKSLILRWDVYRLTDSRAIRRP